MKKYICALFAMAIILGLTVFAGEESPNNGTYPIEVTSSSSMFKIVECQLNVDNGKMTAVMTLSGKGYEKLYMGQKEAAENAADSEFIYYKENPDGKYTYTVPVESLDKEIDCAAFSIKKQQWYDRTLVFESSSLPENALKTQSSNSRLWIIISAAVLCAFIAFVPIVKKKKN